MEARDGGLCFFGGCMNESCCQQEINSKPYKKTFRFHKPCVMVNEINEMGIEKYKIWHDGTNMDEKTKYTRWGFCFEAPICKKANAWRWAWIKVFGKLTVLRWTLPHVYWG